MSRMQEQFREVRPESTVQRKDTVRKLPSTALQVRHMALVLAKGQNEGSGDTKGLFLWSMNEKIHSSHSPPVNMNMKRDPPVFSSTCCALSVVLRLAHLGAQSTWRPACPRWNGPGSTCLSTSCPRIGAQVP